MKKCFILSAVLSIAAVCALVFCLLWISDEHDAITVRMETVSGDVSAAEGLYANIRTISGSYASWDTGFYVEDDPKEDVQFYYNAPNHYSSRETLSSYVFLKSDFNYGVGSSGSIDIEDYSPSKLIKITAMHTPSGGTHAESFDLRDYYEYLPLECEIYIDSENYVDKSIYEEKIFDYFKIPVNFSCQVDITVEKNMNGDVSGIDVSGSGLNVSSDSAAAEKGIYFIISAEGEEGVINGLAEMSCGYGIYFLPYDENGEIETVQTFDPYETYLGLIDISNDGKALYVLAEENGMWVVYVYSADDCSFIERLELGERGDSFVNPYIEDGYALYVFSDGRVSLINEAGGQYVLAVNGVTDIYYFYQLAYAWDGKRFAVCDYDWSSFEYLKIYVLSGEDLLYCGSVRHSQQKTCQLNFRTDALVKLEFK